MLIRWQATNSDPGEVKASIHLNSPDHKSLLSRKDWQRNRHEP